MTEDHKPGAIHILAQGFRVCLSHHITHILPPKLGHHHFCVIHTGSLAIGGIVLASYTINKATDASKKNKNKIDLAGKSNFGQEMCSSTFV